MKILVLNAGSSSQKSSLYTIISEPPSTPLEPLWEAYTDWTGLEQEATLSTTVRGHTKTITLPTQERSVLLEHMLRTLWFGDDSVLSGPEEITAVGHRIVHGGTHYRESVLLTPQIQEDIQRLSDFAPLHNPANLEGVVVSEHLLGKIPQIAVFDTAYHRTLPLVAQVYPGLYNWFEQGILRYGFHGISHQYCARRSAEILGRPLDSLRIVSCHLGNGCSLAAIRAGRSIDTTMGFTPLEGLMMGTRSGSIDPSILLYLQRMRGYSVSELDHLLNHEAGLKGISGLSSDLRPLLLAGKQGNQRAQLALDLFVYRLRFFIGAMVAALAGIDVLTFTAGIGEHSSEVRAQACQGFEFLNLRIDLERNSASPRDQDIARSDSSVRVLVVHTEENWEIARECWHCLSSSERTMG